MSRQEFAGIDAAGRSRVSQPFLQYNGRQLFDKLPLLVSESTSGDGSSTHTSANMRVRMTVVGGTDRVIRQTFMRFEHSPGKSTLIGGSGVFTSSASVYKRFGYWDGTDGIYFENYGGTITWNIMKGGSVVETVAQSAWNIDRMIDVNGPSAEILDLTDIQEPIIDIASIADSVRVGFKIKGVIIYVHEFYHANNGFANSYMGNINLPVRFDILSAGGGGDLDMFSAYVISEGLQNGGVGIPRAVDKGSTAQTIASTVKSPILTMRLQSGRESAIIKLLDLSIIAASTSNFRWGLCLNPTLSATIAYSALGNSSVEYASGYTTQTVTAEGTLLHSGYVKSAISSLEHVLTGHGHRIGKSLAGTMDILCVFVQNLSGGNEDYIGALNFVETP